MRRNMFKKLWQLCRTHTLRQSVCLLFGGHRLVYNDGPQRCIFCDWRPEKEIKVKGFTR